MKAKDLREKSVEDLQELHKSLVHDVFQNRLKNFTNRLDDTSMIRKSRRDLARVVTLLREKQSGKAVPAPSPSKAAIPAATPSKPAAKAKAPKAETKSAAPKKAAAKKTTAKKSEAK